MRLGSPLMLISLLTHPRETNRNTNTGQLAVKLGLASTYVWHRATPNKSLLAHIARLDTVLLYPNENQHDNTADQHTPHYLIQSSMNSSPVEHYEHVIIIDATWQEARKIVNRSPYLQCLPRCMLTPNSPSIFSLRRNQKAQGLCTAECVIQILKSINRKQSATVLHIALEQFIAQYGKS